MRKKGRVERKVENQWTNTKKQFGIANEQKKCAKINRLGQVNCKHKINQKETQEGRTHCVYTECIEYSSSTSNSAAQKLNPTDTSQIITSVT